jgi:hypothetical protein
MEAALNKGRAERGGAAIRAGIEGATGKSTRRRDVVEAARAETERVRWLNPDMGYGKVETAARKQVLEKRSKIRAAMTSRRAECAQPVAFSRQFGFGCSVVSTSRRQVFGGLMRPQPNYSPQISSIDPKSSFSAISIPAAFSPTPLEHRIDPNSMCHPGAFRAQAVAFSRHPAAAMPVGAWHVENSRYALVRLPSTRKGLL